MACKSILCSSVCFFDYARIFSKLVFPACKNSRETIKQVLSFIMLPSISQEAFEDSFFSNVQENCVFLDFNMTHLEISIMCRVILTSEHIFILITQCTSLAGSQIGSSSSACFRGCFSLQRSSRYQKVSYCAYRIYMRFCILLTSFFLVKLSMTGFLLKLSQNSCHFSVKASGVVIQLSETLFCA